MMISELVQAQTDLALTDTYDDIIRYYFVAAHTLSGSRFYSDPVKTFQEAEKIFSDYVSVIDYFKGGEVEIYQISRDDYTIVAYTRI